MAPARKPLIHNQNSCSKSNESYGFVVCRMIFIRIYLYMRFADAQDLKTSSSLSWVCFPSPIGTLHLLLSMHTHKSIHSQWRQSPAIISKNVSQAGANAFENNWAIVEDKWGRTVQSNIFRWIHEHSSQQCVTHKLGTPNRWRRVNRRSFREATTCCE